MALIVLEGCRTDTLGSYLQGLGVWNAVVRVLDPTARAAWRGGRLVLTTELTGGQLLLGLLDHFEPLPVVSPWNGGSGFSGNGKSKEAERLLALVLGTTDPRWAAVREAVEVAEDIVELCREQGWAGSGSEMWAKDDKPKVIEVCRNLLPDAALDWLDAAVAITTDGQGGRDVDFNRLLGTGGNFGRQDLQATYLSRAVAVQLDPRTARSAKGWVNAVLFAEEGTAYLRETVGQFDPGRAGGIMTSPGETADDKGFANPWQFLFMIEGALMFAAAVVRRQGGGSSGMALPFVVWPSRVGYGTSAPGENVMAEFWAPEWDRPAGLAEIQQVIGEARMQWRGGPARTGLDAARAVSTMGVARGLTAFTRYVIAERLGQNPLATAVGSVTVRARPDAGMLGAADAWLQQVLRVSDLPSSIAALARAVEERIFDATVDHADDWRPPMRDVLVAVGRLHQAVSRSSKVREQVRPLVLHSSGWWEALGDSGDPRARRADDVEARLARALACATDRPPRQAAVTWRAWPVRTLVTPVAPDGPTGRLKWTDASAAVSLGAGVTAAIAAAHHRRTMLEGIVDAAAADGSATGSGEVATSGAKGRFTTFAGVRWRARSEDVEAWLRGELDEVRLGDLLLGALLIAAPRRTRASGDASGIASVPEAPQAELDEADTAQRLTEDGFLAEHEPPTEGEPVDDAGATATRGDIALPIPVGLALLLPFFGVDPVAGPARRDGATREPAPGLLLRPQPTWIPRLIAGRLTEVLSEAASWLRYVGVRNLPDPAVAADSLPRVRPGESDASVGQRLAAVLLVPVNQSTRSRALRLVGDGPQPSDLTISGISEGASA